MNNKKKKNSVLTQNESGILGTFNMLSLKDLVNGMSEDGSGTLNKSFSKKVDFPNEKLQNDVVEESLEILTGCEELHLNLNALEPRVKANVTIKITEKCHRNLSELKLIDDFRQFRYSDIVEALLNGFIQNNKTEIKKKLSNRKSPF